MNKDETLNNSNRFEAELETEYSEYVKNFSSIFPGTQTIKDAFCQIISKVQDEDQFVKPPAEQKEYIKKIQSLFEKVDENPKMFYLYPDYLQHGMMKDLEFRNSPEQVKETLINFFIIKFFKMNNQREKIISKSNMIMNVRMI